MHGGIPAHAFGPMVHAHASTVAEQIILNFVFPEPAILRTTVEYFADLAVEFVCQALAKD
jgi:hypothetical protein